jgi:hypothetical protein
VLILQSVCKKTTFRSARKKGQNPWFLAPPSDFTLAAFQGLQNYDFPNFIISSGAIFVMYSRVVQGASQALWEKIFYTVGGIYYGKVTRQVSR